MTLKHSKEALKACRLLGAILPQFRWSQYRFLLTVAENPGLTQTQVAKKLDLTIAAVSRAVDVFGPRGRKERGQSGRGFVTVTRDPDDDRNLLLSITPAGLSFLELVEQSLWGDE